MDTRPSLRRLSARDSSVSWWRGCAALTLRLVVLGAALAACGSAGPAPEGSAGPPPATRAASAGRPRLVAQARWASGREAFGHEIGGLSGLAYDREADLFYAVADDPSGSPPARVLRFRWQPPAPPVPVGWVVLTADGAPLGAGADLEGLVLLPGGELLVSSEGDARGGLAPWVARFDPAGALRERLPLPAHFLPGEGVGPSHNASLEGLAADGEGGVVAGSEGELLQDAASRPRLRGEPVRRSRLLRWDLSTPGLPREWLYPLDPPHAPAPWRDALRVAGLAELLADGAGRLLALERSFVAGVGYRVRLYRLALDGGDEVTGQAAVGAAPRTARKGLIVDFATLGVPLDNYEGLAWGPLGESGRPLLVVVSDNNFRDDQDTHLLALAW